MRLDCFRVMALIAVWTSLAHAEDRIPRTFEIIYRVSLGEVSGHARVWIPVPQNTAHQGITRLNVHTKAAYSRVTDSVYGNQFVLLEREYGNIEASIRFAVDRTPWNVTTAEHTVTLSGDERARYLDPSRLVITDGIVRDEAERIAGGATTTHAKARRLYDHIVNTMTYDKSGKGWGRGDAVYACDTRTGNCTDFHSLFIGEARSLGVPSRFLMGFSVPRGKPSGEIGGYHCWAEFYEDRLGWIPLDASEAFKDQTRRDELFGGLDADRVLFTVGRDIKLPGMAGEPLNFAIYPYVEVDGKPQDGATFSLTFHDTID